MSNSNHAEAVRALFDSVVDLSPGDWEAKLNGALEAGVVRAVVDEVRAMVSQLSIGPDASRGTAVNPIRAQLDRATQARTLPPPEHVGVYRIVSRLGQGSYGDVYLAERSEPLVQQVAIKLLRPGMDSREVLTRFDRERVALAKMNHPNVARVIDAGATQQGRPYFVMEYIPGLSITRHCDQQRLSVRQRLELFLLVCEGVQHAHRRGIIHRDLKPSNTLVGMYEGKGVPKVIDFGIAKAMTSEQPEEPLLTLRSDPLGTPEYMSPEQATAGAADVDTRTDVYALGVMLYELLTGHLPFDSKRLRSGSSEDAYRIIRDEEPPRPSQRVRYAENVATVADARGTTVDSLVRLLRRELEWIPLKAMRKDRSRRYASVDAMAADIRRYLESRPLEAAPDHVAYRARKFVHRNKRGLTVAAIVLALLASTAVAWQRTRDAKHQQLEYARLKIQHAEARGQWREVLALIDQGRGARKEIALDLRLTRVRALDALGQSKDVRSEVDAILEHPQLGEHRAEALIWAGDVRLMKLSKQEVERATSLLQEGLDLADRDAGQRVSRADVWYCRALLARDPDAAIEALRQAIRLDPSHLRAAQQLFVAHCFQGRYEEALASAKNLASMFADNPRTQAWVVVALAVNGRIDDAKREMLSLSASMSREETQAVAAAVEAIESVVRIELSVSELGKVTMPQFMSANLSIVRAQAKLFDINGQVRSMPSVRVTMPNLLQLARGAPEKPGPEQDRWMEEVENIIGKACTNIMRALNANEVGQFDDADRLLAAAENSESLINLKGVVAELRPVPAIGRWRASRNPEHAAEVVRRIRLAIASGRPVDSMSWGAYATTAFQVGDQNLCRYLLDRLIETFPAKTKFVHDLAHYECEWKNYERTLELCRKLDTSGKGSPQVAALAATARQRITERAEELRSAQ